ncbi:carboxylesterase/lipase family protein [Sphingomonas sp.]|uniref:carboxylesterase/lipase family protein n=1 Tax=Sphingomonas sp. TaxID=28214 RepID=UPI003B3B5DC4
MILTALALAAATPGTIVSTTNGAIAGEAMPDGRRLFRGIPFAQPPVGPLRWREPVAVPHWTSVRDATHSAPACPQIDYGWNHAAAARQSEDCLYLEVATPASPASKKKLPVMVWIHGGGNRAGSGADTTGSDFGKEVVLVTVQYRLGALGFLSHPALTAESPHHTSGNYALMDQQAALRWVQANIARFGGDESNVTIFGESAGAQDVGLQQLSPLARGLFHKAIEESGTAGFGIPPRTLAENERIGTLLAQAAGAPANADAATLRALPVETLLKISEDSKIPGLASDSFIWLAATADGWVLRAPPATTLARREGARVPLIIGSNSREFAYLGAKDPLDRAISTGFGANAAQARSFYDSTPDPDPERGDRRLQVSTDLIFACPAGVVAAHHAAAGLPVWQYEFGYVGPGGKPVVHAGELPYVMQAGARLPAGAPPMHAYWLNFARTGDPNGAGLPAWPGYAPGKRYVRFTDRGVSEASNLRGDVCRLRNAP